MPETAPAQSNVQPTPNGTRWAPGIAPMLGWGLVLNVSMAFMTPVSEALGVPRPWAYAVMLAIAVGSGILCHMAYLKAERSLAADPALRGRWLVAHAWWFLVVLVFAMAAGVYAGMYLRYLHYLP